jgi:endonuclease/exonuclease/phosphatase family metal-dependent hydrolase
MAYKQANNPLSRKTSPLKKVNPYEKGLGNTITEEELDLTSGSTSVHEGEKPAPKLSSGDMSVEPGDKDYEAISRKSSSPLNAHDEVQKEIDAARAAWKEKYPDGAPANIDFYEEHADLYKKQEEARLAHKEEKPKEEKTR